MAFEVARQLEEAGVGHALVDMDELDRIFPDPPGDSQKTHLTRQNLAAVWANLRDAGASRLILTMVATYPDHELPHIREAVQGSFITLVRLHATEEVLLERVRRREVGSGLEHHIGRTVEQTRLMARQSTEGLLTVDTSRQPVAEIAREILVRTGWAGRSD